MSAYGTIARPTSTRDTRLEPRLVPLASREQCLAVFPLRADAVPAELAQHLRDTFNAVVAEGRTYPQLDTLDDDAFRSYYLGAMDLEGRACQADDEVAYDVFVGLLYPRGASLAIEGEGTSVSNLNFDQVRDGRSWHDCVAGMYCTPASSPHDFAEPQADIKPNYPGRA
jgi:hypothetical protein